MKEIYNVLAEFIPCLLTVVPALVGCVIFHWFLRFSMRLLRGDVVLYREHNEPDTNEPDIKEPESFDIPEKQRDFIQLN